MRVLGERRLTEREVDDLIAEADVNRDGDIDYEEFVKMLTRQDYRKIRRGDGLCFNV